MNKVVLIGRLTKDPELRTTPSGVSAVNFSIAVNRNFRNKDGVIETDFFNVTAWFIKRQRFESNILFR